MSRYGSHRKLTSLVFAVVALVPAGLWAGDEPRVRVVVEPKVRVVTPSPGEHFERRVVVDPGNPPKVFVWSGEGEPGRPLLMLGRGFLGVQLTELTPDLRAHFGVGDSGVLVGRVEPDSPAAKAGLRVGDILTAVDGESVESGMDATRAIRRKKDGEVTALEVWRDGRVQNLTATIAERDRHSIDMGPMLWEHRIAGDDPELRDKVRLGLAPALERLEGLLDDPELKDRMLRLRSRNEELEKRLKDLESRLQDLEKRLGDGSR
jgi:PDZ domain